MRLLELRHGETGRTSGAVRHVSAGFGTETNAAGAADVPIDNAPRMRVAVAAAPKTGVIPGALVSVAIDVFNDGTAPAPESKLVLSLPIESEFRSSTLRVDGREVPAPERLFGDGLPVARLPGDTSAKIVFQLQVLPGLHPLYLQPRLLTNGVAVVGTPGISIKRAGAPGTRIAVEPERPFYELDAEELASEEAAVALPIVPPVLPPAPAPAAIMADAPVADEPPAAPKRARRTAAPADARMSRYRTLAQTDVAMLDRLFGIDPPGLAAHLMMISTVACHEPEDRVDTSGYGEVIRSDGEALGRALVLARLGKPVDLRIEQSALGALLLPWEPTRPPTATPRRSPRRLRRDLSEPECRAIGGLVQPSKRDPHLRLRIALLALAGATIEGVSRTIADECVTALASYRSAVLAWLIPLCVASMSGQVEPLPPPPANVDAAGRRLASALRAAYAE